MFFLKSNPAKNSKVKRFNIIASTGLKAIKGGVKDDNNETDDKDVWN